MSAVVYTSTSHRPNHLNIQSFVKFVSFYHFSRNSSFQSKTKLKSKNHIQNIFTNHNNTKPN